MPAQANRLHDWMQRASTMQAQVMEAQARLNEAETTASSGGVALTLAATGELRDIQIDREALGDPTELRRLILLVHGQAIADIQQMARNMLAPFQQLAGEIVNET
jgi:DNA-binding protein YbaB